MTLYAIRDWSNLFENNRTRELKKLDWVPIPNKQDGDGYTELITMKDGPALFGTWNALVQIASKCDPRGTLIRSSGHPHTTDSLSRLSRIPPALIARALPILVNIGWMTSVPATIPQEGAEIPQEGITEGKGRERREGKGIEENDSDTYHPDSVTALLWLNEQAGTHYRQLDSSLGPISARLKEPGVDLEGVKQMINRQCSLWKGTTMQEYLRPCTLFGKQKFDGYYGNRDMPIASTPPRNQPGAPPPRRFLTPMERTIKQALSNYKP